MVDVQPQPQPKGDPMAKQQRFLTQTTIKKTEDEYRVKAYDQHGNRWKAADCFESTAADAEATSQAMRRHGCEQMAAANHSPAVRQLITAARAAGCSIVNHPEASVQINRGKTNRSPGVMIWADGKITQLDPAIQSQEGLTARAAFRLLNLY